MAAFEGERAVVVGFGASGQAATRALQAEGASVLVSEARSREEIAPRGDPAEDRIMNEPGPELRFGGHRPEHLEGATLLVVSPGVPERAPIIGWARGLGIPVWSELELGARLCRVPVLAVTGTNGKTTTVELVASMMRAAGLRARACGNVGYPLSLAAREPFDALVVEASSFQLRFHESLHPRVSVLLNLAPDHLDWHGSFTDYVESKARIFLRQGPGDVHIGNRDDHEAAPISRRASCEVRWFGRGSPAASDVGIEADRVIAGGGRGEFAVAEGSTRASLVDAAAAVAAALSFGIPSVAIAAGLAAAKPLPHRGSVIAEAGSVRFVDDSKATNPHAALAALDGLTGAVLIAGGRAKGVDLSPLAAAAPSLAGVVAIGEAASAVARIFDGLVPVMQASSMEEAVGAALGMAPERGTVILAPACASQDMFRDYRERGDRFAEAARALAEGGTRQATLTEAQGLGSGRGD